MVASSLLIFIIFLAVKSLQKTNTFLKTRTKQGTSIAVSADNSLDGVLVNSVTLDLPPFTDDWTKTKIINTPIYYSDIIIISGSNTGAINATNPAALIATINYIDTDGLQKSLSTGSSWTCNEFPANVLGTNSDANSIWETTKGGPLDTINPTAQWIWANSQDTLAACSIRIPGTYKPGNIDATADNILQSIIINGEPQILPGNTDNWTVTKSVKTNIKTGDTIIIIGTQLEGDITKTNPAGILATVQYYDLNSNSIKALSTDANWACNGKPAVLQGANNDPSTIWFKDNSGGINPIDESAQWIWADNSSFTASCSIKIQ